MVFKKPQIVLKTKLNQHNKMTSQLVNSEIDKILQD